MTDVHLPDLSVPRPYPGEQVGPTYSSAPAPMGVADLGLTDTSGTVTPYILDTSSVEGTISLTNAQAVYVDGDGPDTYGVQLNAVDTGVTIFGDSTNEMWTQNFGIYTPSSQQLTLGDNIWNFSNFAAYFSPNALYAHGPNGTVDPGVLYYATGPTFTISYPFTLSLFENATVVSDRPAIYLNYTLSNSTMSTSGTYDYVVFNSTSGTPTSPAPSGQFEINGEQVDPVGLPNDLELDVVGNTGGDTTTFYQMTAALSIATWNSTSDVYDPVPSAMDAGAETGETSDGVSVHWTSSTPVAQMTLGPSFLYGLWNESFNSGAREVVQTVDPAPTFIFVNPGAALNASTAQWVVSSPSGTTTFFIPNGGSYWFEYLLADRAPGGMAANYAANSTTTTSFTSAADAGAGVYTPLIAFANSELASLSSGGTGSAGRPYTLLNNEFGSLDPEFAAFNDYQFPVFPGVLLVGTSSNVIVTPPSFQIDYPAWMLPTLAIFGLPTTNNLQLQFWETSHVRVIDGRITGWLSGFLAQFPEGSVMFWNASNNIVAGNTFLDQGDAIDLYGGTGNTIWGNVFVPTVVGATNPNDVLNYGPSTQGVNESESGDLIYNNYFAVPLPAITPNFDPFTCQFVCLPTSYTDSWNVSLESASASQTVLGVTLTGSIIGTWYQGGNYWANYGGRSNPYGVLPFNDTGAITVRGDYIPLVPFELYDVTFQATGLLPGVSWGVTALGVTTMSNLAALTVSAPNGTDYYSIVNPAGYTSNGSGSFTVAGSSTIVDLTFASAVNLTFAETGLPAGLTWSVELNGSELGGVADNYSAVSGTPIVFAASTGDYFFNVSSAGYAAVPPSGQVTVDLLPRHVNLVFGPGTALTFNELGLPGNTTWTVSVTQGSSTTALSGATASIAFSAALATPGPYTFSVAAVGFTPNPALGEGSLPLNSTQNVTFALDIGTLTVAVLPVSAALWVDGGIAPLNSTGAFSITLPIGIHSLEVTASGYEPYFNNVTLNPGQTTRVSVALVALPTSSNSGSGGISTAGWALIGVLALLAAIFLVMTLIFAGRRRQPPQELTPFLTPSPTAGTIVPPITDSSTTTAESDPLGSPAEAPAVSSPESPTPTTPEPIAELSTPSSPESPSTPDTEVPGSSERPP